MSKQGQFWENVVTDLQQSNTKDNHDDDFSNALRVAFILIQEYKHRRGMGYGDFATARILELEKEFAEAMKCFSVGNV